MKFIGGILEYKTLLDSIVGYSVTLGGSIITVTPELSQTEEETKAAIEQYLPETFYKYSLRALVRDEFKGVKINSIDYTSTKHLKKHIQRKDVFDKGRLVKVEYFEDYDKSTDTGTNKLMNVDIVYTDGPDFMVAQRETTRSWMIEGTEDAGIQTTSIKKYTNFQGVKEGTTRRNNNVDNLKLSIPGLIMQLASENLSVARSKGREFFNEYENSFSSYIEVDDRTIIADIDSADRVKYDWLDLEIQTGYTIADYLKGQLDY